MERSCLSAAARWLPTLIWWLPRLSWVVLLILTLVWVVQVEGSLGFDLDTTFGWHAWFMLMAGPVCLGEALLAVSLPNNLGVLAAADPLKRRQHSVLLHLGLHLLSLVFAILGLVAIGYYKQLNAAATFPFWSMFSPHSWLGVAVLTLWTLQFIARLLHYAIRSPALRLVSNRLHLFFGKVIFVSALATCALGFQDMQGSDLSVDVDYMAYQPWSIYANLACASVLMLLVLGIAVLIAPELISILDCLTDGQQQQQHKTLDESSVMELNSPSAASSSPAVFPGMSP